MVWIKIKLIWICVSAPSTAYHSQMLTLTSEECVHTIIHVTHLLTHCSSRPLSRNFEMWHFIFFFRPSLERHYGWCMFPRVHVSSSKSHPLISEHFLSMQTVPISLALSINLIISAVTNWQSCRMTLHHFTVLCIHGWTMRQWAPVVSFWSFCISFWSFLSLFIVVLCLFVVVL